MFLTFALTCADAYSKPQEVDRALPGVVGVDDREAVPKSGNSYAAVGHINVTGFRSKRQCTGTLIAPDRVLTAAHCLVDGRNGKPVPLSHIHFVAGVTGSRSEAHAKAKCVRLAREQFKPIRKLSPNLRADMAVIMLDRKLGIEPVAPLFGVKIDRRNLLIHPSYPRDSRYRLLVHSGCRIRAQKYGLWQTNCDTNFASSGGPVMVTVGERDYVAAVMVGFVEREFTIAVPVSAWKGLVTGESCDSRQTDGKP